MYLMEGENNFYINKVLLVEDDYTLGSLLRYKLEDIGIELIHACSGNEALEFFKTNHQPVLIVIDYELNDITGDVLIQKLKDNGIEYPFIAITGAGSEEIAGDFLRLGAEDYVIKDLGFLNKIENSILRTLKSFSNKKIIEEQQKVITQNEERYRMIFENIQDVYLVIDQHYHIKEISPSIEQILHIPFYMLINQPVFYILNNKKQWKIAFKTLLEKGILLNHEIELCNKAKNKYATCQINAKLVEINGSKCAVITLRDISEIKQLQKELLNIVAITEEKERRKISENLHDIVAPLFATSKIYFSRAFEKNKDEKERQELYNEGIKLLDEGIQNLREISSELISQVLNQFGLEKALMQFINKHSKIKDTKIYFNFNTKENRFKPALENLIYRTTTELIHNSLKHSYASTIKIEIVQKENTLVILFQDDGIGFNYDKEVIKEKLSVNKQGLFSITYRIKMFSGSIEFKRLEKGTIFIIEIPIK